MLVFEGSNNRNDIGITGLLLVEEPNVSITQTTFELNNFISIENIENAEII